MEQLPIEIHSSICQQLQRWTLSDQPFAHLTETSIYGTDGWLTQTIDACRDICNFRLTCHRMYVSSFSTFGELLGSRIFRMTKVGVDDLLAVSRMPALTPYIRTLTFGNARFGSIAGNPLLEEMLDNMSWPDRTRLRFAYSDNVRWSAKENESFHTRLFMDALEGLHQLKHLRLLISDQPSTYRHLGGWLEPNDHAVVAKALSSISEIWLADDCIYELNIGNGAIFRPLLLAINATGVLIQDLRIGHGYALFPHNLAEILHLTGATTRVQRLRHEVDPQYLCFNPLAPPAGHYWNAFSKLNNVTHLSLSMTRDAAFNDFALATSNLLRLLTPLTQLQQLTIRGVWTYSEKDVLEFVSARKSQLTQFVLMGPVLLDSCWSLLLQRLMSHLTLRTKHIQFTNMSKRESNTRIIPALDNTGWQTFLNEIKPHVDRAPYSVCLSSDHRRYIHYPSQH